MKINDILNCINKSLEKERQEKQISKKGFFMSYGNYKKCIGNIKEFNYYIDFVIDKNTKYHISSVSYSVPCLSNEVELFKENTIEPALFTDLFEKLKTEYDKFLNVVFEDGNK